MALPTWGRNYHPDDLHGSCSLRGGRDLRARTIAGRSAQDEAMISAFWSASSGNRQVRPRVVSEHSPMAHRRIHGRFWHECEHHWNIAAFPVDVQAGRLSDSPRKSFNPRSC